MHVLLEFKKSKLRLLKISYGNCPGLSPAVLPQFTLKMCVTVRNREKFTTILYFEGLKSFKVIDVDTPKKLVTSACDMISCMSVLVCNCFHAR